MGRDRAINYPCGGPTAHGEWYMQQCNCDVDSTVSCRNTVLYIHRRGTLAVKNDTVISIMKTLPSKTLIIYWHRILVSKIQSMVITLNHVGDDSHMMLTSKPQFNMQWGNHGNSLWEELPFWLQLAMVVRLC